MCEQNNELIVLMNNDKHFSRIAYDEFRGHDVEFAIQVDHTRVQMRKNLSRFKTNVFSLPTLPLSLVID